ncbi:hypothetical protein [uncultured Intestinimonas sp.]|uniref:hypothetical protein n=1 Tax=uncultured Intestinimonas sp. TaxID=1689265 RepID=UPI0025F1EEF8|nr:hypothetical protein [uncultured Intestinimonas sp.]
MYDLNAEVLSHRARRKHLLVFEKRKDGVLYFAGEYALTETHQNVQPDEDGVLRRVFVFHLAQIAEDFAL